VTSGSVRQVLGCVSTVIVFSTQVMKSQVFTQFTQCYAVYTYYFVNSMLYAAVCSNFMCQCICTLL
jgi:hypothetical protein